MYGLYHVRVFIWPYLSPSRDSARMNTAYAWTDGPPPATFTVAATAHTVRCATVKVSSESAGAVASNVFLRSLTTRHSRRIAQPDGGAGTPSSGRGCHLQGRSAPPSRTTPLRSGPHRRSRGRSEPLAPRTRVAPPASVPPLSCAPPLPWAPPAESRETHRSCNRGGRTGGMTLDAACRLAKSCSSSLLRKSFYFARSERIY